MAFHAEHGSQKTRAQLSCRQKQVFLWWAGVNGKALSSTTALQIALRSSGAAFTISTSRSTLSTVSIGRKTYVMAHEKPMAALFDIDTEEWTLLEGNPLECSYFIIKIPF